MIKINKKQFKKENEHIHYEELIKRNETKKQLLRKGFKLIDKTNNYKKVLACGFILVGCITIPLPIGSVLLIGLGVGMLGLKKDFLKRRFKLMKYKRKAKRRNKIRC